MHNKIGLDIILNVLAKNAKPEEIEMLNDWLSESEDNRKYFHEAEIIWNQFSNTYDSVEFNEAAAREKILLNIQRRNKPRVLKARFWISAAASFMLLIGLSYLIYHYAANTSEPMLEYAVTEGVIRQVYLPDSSKVWLNSNSSIRFHSAFVNSSRKVWLKGEAYFEVVHDPSHPFKVITESTITEVLGTSFNLKQLEQKGVELNVRTGKVKFSQKNPFRKSYIIEAGGKANYIKQENYIVSERSKNGNYLSWKTGELVFEKASLEEVCTTLSEHYKTSIRSELSNSAYTLTGTFHNEELEDILQTIAITLDLHITSENNTIILSK